MKAKFKECYPQFQSTYLNRCNRCNKYRFVAKIPWEHFQKVKLRRSGGIS